MAIGFASIVLRILVTIISIYVGHLIENIKSNEKRKQRAIEERNQFHEKLLIESLSMEDKKLEEESRAVEEIKELKDAADKTQQRLQELASEDGDSHSDRVSFNVDDNDWDSQDGDANSAEGSVDRVDEEISKMTDEISRLEKKEEELQSLDNQIVECIREHNTDQDIETDTASLDDKQKLDEAMQILNEKIEALDLENKQLKDQLEKYNRDDEAPIIEQTEMDPELIRFLEQHSEVLTLDVLENALETMLEVKASNPDVDFKQYVSDIMKRQDKYASELAEVKIAKKEVEIKLRLMRKRYEESLTSFDQTRVDHIVRASSAKEYLDKLKEKNKINDEIVSSLRTELQAKREELTMLREKLQDAEKQCNAYYNALKEIQAQKDKLEAEQRARQERERNAINYLNLSSASSHIDNQIPPPPAIDIPSVADLLRNIS